MFLSRQEIEKLIKENGLINGYINLDAQLTPNGFDLTVGNVCEFKTAGTLDFSNNERVIPQEKKISPARKTPGDKFGWWLLEKGAYKIKTNEVCNLPANLLAIAFPRSSLLRMGAFTQTGVWDAGFKGKSEFILIVNNRKGIKLKQNARIVQLVFASIRETPHIYKGIYQEKP